MIIVLQPERLFKTEKKGYVDRTCLVLCVGSDFILFTDFLHNLYNKKIDLFESDLQECMIC